jgi:hypothetical protein
VVPVGYHLLECGRIVLPLNERSECSLCHRFYCSHLYDDHTLTNQALTYYWQLLKIMNGAALLEEEWPKLKTDDERRAEFWCTKLQLLLNHLTHAH